MFEAFDRNTPQSTAALHYVALLLSQMIALLHLRGRYSPTSDTSSLAPSATPSPHSQTPPVEFLDTVKSDTDNITGLADQVFAPRLNVGPWFTPPSEFMADFNPTVASQVRYPASTIPRLATGSAPAASATTGSQFNVPRLTIPVPQTGVPPSSSSSTTLPASQRARQHPTESNAGKFERKQVRNGESSERRPQHPGNFSKPGVLAQRIERAQSDSSVEPSIDLAWSPGPSPSADINTGNLTRVTSLHRVGVCRRSIL